MNHIATDRATDAHIAKVADALEASFSQECPTCTGLFCLDCAEHVAHDTCTRRCTTCTTDDVDWDQAWQTSELITELAGLDKLDRAVQALRA